MDDSSLVIKTTVWLATLVVIGVRLLNMIAYNSWGQQQSWLRYFETDRWVLFRILIILSGFTLSVYAFQTHALGHAWGNACIAIISLLPPGISRSHSFDRYRAFIASRSGSTIIFFVIPLALFAFALRNELTTTSFGNAFQAAGGWLLVTGFSSMTLSVWGPRSASSWPYIRLALLWDFLLLLGACFLWNPPLIVLEVAALAIELWNVSKGGRESL